MPQIDNTADLLAAFEERREQLGISQRDLCKRAGMSHSTYWFTQQRGGDLTLRAALRYCNVLGLTLKVAKGRAG